jgi:hypothetical protein
MISPRPRLRDVSPSALRKLARGPMSRFEIQDVSGIATPRGELKANEHWLPTAFVNTRYCVQVSVVDTAIGQVMHLWITRLDREMPRSWSDLQHIKNEIAGPERTAVEVFPPNSELVDQAPMAHLWVYPEDFVIPFRLGGG